MNRKPINTVKLGAFVVAGLAFLLLMLYTIGKNQNLFGRNFILRAHFSNASGLIAGNNVRFSGIDAGTVKEVSVLNDTTIEVTMLIKRSLQKHIRKNCPVSIGTDGLMGNKLVNLEPARSMATAAEEGDVLQGSSGAGTEEVMEVLYKTVNDLSGAAKEIRSTTTRINQSKGLWSLMEDEALPANVSASLVRLRKASAHLDMLMANLETMGSELRQGKGSLGHLLRDTAMAASLYRSEQTLEIVLARTDTALQQIRALTDTTASQLRSGKGALPSLLNDAAMTRKIDRTLTHLEEGTAAFEQSMIALQHNFLLRGYFRKQERRKLEARKDSIEASH
ncbi:MAG: MCE family protein [Chitinophagaceae bacterium]|nr:MAG: MCE family protein [Chitinophagaceae bacterium]